MNPTNIPRKIPKFVKTQVKEVNVPLIFVGANSDSKIGVAAYPKPFY